MLRYGSFVSITNAMDVAMCGGIGWVAVMMGGCVEVIQCRYRSIFVVGTVHSGDVSLFLVPVFASYFAFGFFHFVTGWVFVVGQILYAWQGLGFVHAALRSSFWSIILSLRSRYLGKLAWTHAGAWPSRRWHLVQGAISFILECVYSKS
eukprot:TRINITY_DN60005_c0_g1_i1.p1 TRINITY_DN60005_c0_g1~~TRINITY_DN60005_c0_g1_i1.p1  ORF type:complete len:149 (-),score=13.73 TRINITY_DN60005_c0_g1_i1:5-451(-)